VHPIPLADLSAQHTELSSELEAAIRGVVRSSSFIGGAELKAFSSEFAEFCGVKRTVPCGSGTDALTLAVLGLLGPGDGRREIITVSFTFAATVEVIALMGYRPVLVDVDPQTYLMDLEQVRAAINPRTAAIMPVHLYGQMVPMDDLIGLANQYGLPVIEDAAQAHGASYKGIHPGQHSAAACFSFFPAKNLGAWGDAGAVVTQHDGLADRMASLADHGRTGKYAHGDVGLNARMDNLQAAVLRIKLRHLARWNGLRRKAADRYTRGLAGIPGVQTPVVHPQAHHVYQQYTIRTTNRDELMHHLTENKIGCGVHYPTPVHQQSGYEFLGMSPDALPNTLAASQEVLSLPMFPHLRDEQIDRVCAAVREYAREAVMA
jgi:dTDP-4-amino-4,6-dideoxygalactose transaminase